MPTYGPQLLAFRDFKTDPTNLDRIFQGYDARSQRHESAIASYNKYVSNIMDSPTLDPVEKQRRLDSLRDDFFSMNERYQGNLSDARDDIMDLIVQNRKDPYWQADKARTEGYQRAMEAGQKMALQGQSPLYQTATGEYITDLDQRFGSLTDEFGNYRPLTDYDIMATKQLNYEAPLREAFGSIKANMSSVLGRPVTEGEVAQMMGNYIQYGTTRSNNANIDIAMQGVIENYMTTPEWKQLQGRYGEGAYEMLQGMAGNVADQYRFSEQNVKPMFAPKETQGSKNNFMGYLDTTNYPSTETGAKKLGIPDNFIDKSGKLVEFDTKYPNLSKAIDDNTLSSFSLKSGASMGPVEAFVGSNLDAIWNNPFNILRTTMELVTGDNLKSELGKMDTSDYRSFADNIINSGMKTKPEDMSTDDWAEYKAKVKSELTTAMEDSNFNLAKFRKESNKAAESLDVYKLIDDSFADMDARTLVDNVNPLIQTGTRPIELSPMYSDVVFKNSENLLNDKEGRNLSNVGSEGTVYTRDANSGEWKVVEGDDYTDVGKEFYKPDPQFKIRYDANKGFGLFTTNGKDDLFIPMSANISRGLDNIGKFELASQEIRQPITKTVDPNGNTSWNLFKITSGLKGPVAHLRTKQGPVVMEHPNMTAQQLNNRISNMYSRGNTSNQIINELTQEGAVLADPSIYYNALVNSKGSMPIEKRGSESKSQTGL